METNKTKMDEELTEEDDDCLEVPIDNSEGRESFKEGSESVLIKFQDIEVALSSARIDCASLTNVAYGLVSSLKQNGKQNGGTTYTG